MGGHNVKIGFRLTNTHNDAPGIRMNDRNSLAANIIFLPPFNIKRGRRLIHTSHPYVPLIAIDGIIKTPPMVLLLEDLPLASWKHPKEKRSLEKIATITCRD